MINKTENESKWSHSSKERLLPDLFCNIFNRLKLVKIIIFLFFLLWLGFAFFSIIQIGPRNGGYLVPISILKYEDLSMSQSGDLRIHLNNFTNNLSLNLFPTLKGPLQTEKEILEFLNKKNKAGSHENIVFRIDGRALPSGDGDITLLPSNYGTNSNANGIPLSEILYLIMEFPCKNRLVFIDVMAPWNNISHGGLLWDLGFEIKKTVELAKTKYKEVHGFSAESINFHLWSTSGEGGFSHQKGIYDTLFYDQLYSTLDRLIQKQLSGFNSYFNLKNISEIVNNAINVKCFKIYGNTQNSFLIGWGKQFPIVPPTKVLTNETEALPESFTWPEEYLAAWKSFSKLKNENGYKKNPKAMLEILNILINFQNTWIQSNLNPTILKNLITDINFHMKSFIDFDKNKIANLTSIVELSDRFTPYQLNEYKNLFHTTFGNLKNDKEETLITSLKSKEFVTTIEKLTPLELELVLLDSIISSTNYNSNSIIAIFDLITKHHKEILAFETFGLKRLLIASKTNPEFNDINFIKTCMRARIECNKLYYSLFKNDLIFKGMQQAMNSLDNGDWLLENADGNQIQDILTFYYEAEKIAKLTLIASKSLEKIVTVFDRTVIELSLSTRSTFPGTEILFPLLEQTEKLGKFVLKCELEMQNFPLLLNGPIDEKKTLSDLSDFIYKTDLIYSPFERELNILKDQINYTLIPLLLNKESKPLENEQYLPGDLGIHLLIFANDNNIKNLLDYITVKVIGLNDILELKNLKNFSFLKENELSKRPNNLSLLRYDLVLIHISLMRAIGLENLASKLNDSLKRIDKTQSRSKQWNDLIKLLPKLYYSDLNMSQTAIKFPTRDRLNYIFNTLNIISDNSSLTAKTTLRFNHHLTMVENILNSRFSRGLDVDFCSRIIQEIIAHSVPLIPIHQFVPEGDMSLLVLTKNENNVNREFSFSGIVHSKTVPTIQLVENTGSNLSVSLSDIKFENIRSTHHSATNDKQQSKITGKIIVSSLENNIQSDPVFSKIILKINCGFQTSFYRIPVKINSLNPELEIVLRKINGDIVNDNFSIRTLLDGEKFSFYVRNNTQKPREAFIKLFSNKSKQIYGDSKILLPNNDEVPIIFKPRTAPSKPDTGFSFDFSNMDKIVIEITDNLKPNIIYQQRSFNPKIIDPSDYIFIEDAKYHPNTSSDKGPSIRLNLKSRNKDLSPQPFVNLSINQAKTPGFKSGTGLTSLFLKPDNATEVFLKDLVFDTNLPDTGEVNLDVDYFKRCFKYGFNSYSYGSPSSLTLIKGNEIRFSGNISLSDQNILTFPIETDGGSNDTLVDIGMWDYSYSDKAPEDFSRAEVSSSFSSTRNKSFKLNQKNGEANFTLFSFVDDWKIQWDVSGSSGKKVIHAWMKDEKGKVIAKASKNITIDYTPPRLFNFQVLSDITEPGKAVRFSINAQDRESGISKINAYYSKQGGDKPMLIELPLVKNEDIPDQWVSSFIIPADSKSAVEVSVVAVNGLGKSFTLSKEIKLVTSTPAPLVTCIKGVVKEGGRLQAGLIVTLYNSKTKKNTVITTNDNGEFIFENLEALNYKITVEKPASSRTVTKVIDLKIGQTVNLNLELLQ